MSKRIIALLILLALSGWAYGAMRDVKAAVTEQPFSHENCQYPNRETNPPNGCDNSDPACPETIKYGYDCQPINQPTPEPVVAPIEKAPEMPKEETPKGCYE